MTDAISTLPDLGSPCHAADQTLRFRARCGPSRCASLSQSTAATAFLQQVASSLQSCGDRPGVVHRVCAETQRAFFDPPDLSRPSRAGGVSTGRSPPRRPGVRPQGPPAPPGESFGWDPLVARVGHQYGPALPLPV